jgi:hypothetical protein
VANPQQKANFPIMRDNNDASIVILTMVLAVCASPPTHPDEENCEWQRPIRFFGLVSIE